MTIASRGASLAIAVSLAFTPFASQAWFFPVAEGFGGFRSASAQNEMGGIAMDGNSQTISLLNPRVSMSSDRKAIDDEASITIVDDEALSATMGTGGSLADVIDDESMGDISVYVVKPGDTVATVAKLYGVTENTIRWTNGMSKTDVLRLGTTLLIMPFNGIKYTVAKGDTLAGIEKKFGLSSGEIDDLLSYNNLESNTKVSVGQVIYIPGAELETAAVATTKSTTSKVKTTSGTTNVTRGYFIKPVTGPSCRMSQGKHDRYAIDLACPMGTPIKAAAAGKVRIALYGWNGAFGNLVVIDHPNGSTTYYAHIKDGGIAVKQGESVTQGQVIAYVGSTGRSTGPHVHFEVRGSAINPGFDKSGSAWK